MKMPKWSLMTKNQKLASVLAVGLVCSGFYLRMQATTKVAYYEVGSQHVEQLVHLNANISPKAKQEYLTEVSGVLVAYKVQTGAEVKKDELLATVKPFDFETKQKGFDQSMKGLLAADPSLKPEMLTKLTEISKRYELTQSTMIQSLEGYASVQKLYKDQMISDLSYREALTQLKTAVLSYLNENKQILADVAAFYADNVGKTKEISAVNAIFEPLYSMKLLLEPQQVEAKASEAPAETVSPIELKALKDATITKLIAEPSLFIPAGGYILETGDLSVLSADMEIPVIHLADVKLGSEVRVKDLDGNVINGKVSFIDSNITDQMSSDGSIVKLVKIKADFMDQPKLKIYDAISVSVVAKQSESEVVVPAELIFEKKGEPYVWINENGVLTEKPIAIAFEVDGLVVIQSGVKAGDKLVMDTKLKPGQKIKF